MARMGDIFSRNDVFLHSGDAKDKNDYDSLLTPPGTPLFQSHEAAPKNVLSEPNWITKVSPKPLGI